MNPKKINISNDPNKYEKDYSDLPNDTIIHYGKYWDMYCSKEAFIKYQSKLIPLKRRVHSDTLSPVEKLMMAFDIVKAKPYNLSNDDSWNGLPHEVLLGDYICCRGYCNLLVELLAGENIPITDLDMSAFYPDRDHIDHHSMCAVLLDDDKYDIHGLFLVGPTEDRYNAELREQFGMDLQPTDLYCTFLLPIREPSLYHRDDHELRITNLDADTEGSMEWNPSCYENPEYRLQNLVMDYDLEDLEIVNEIAFERLFDGLTKDQLLSYINTDYIDFDLLLEIIKNVRRAQGYSEESLKIEIDRIRRVNINYFSTEPKHPIRE